MTTQSKSKLGDEETRTMEASIPLVLNDVQTLNLGGTNYTIPQVTAKIAAFIQAQADTLSALNTYRAAVVAERGKRRCHAVIFRGQVQGYAISRFGKTSPVLSKLSFHAARPEEDDHGHQGRGRPQAARDAQGAQHHGQEAAPAGEGGGRPLDPRDAHGGAEARSAGPAPVTCRRPRRTSSRCRSARRRAAEGRTVRRGAGPGHSA